MSDKFKIALPGSDVSSASLKELILDSTYPSLKVDTLANPVHAGIISVDWKTTGLVIPANTTKILYQFQHNYDYIPTVIGTYAYDAGLTKSEGLLPLLLEGGTATAVLTIDSDKTYINLKYYSGDGSNSISPFLLKVRFYVFAERGIY